jgi:gliding motility-associated-like protein
MNRINKIVVGSAFFLISFIAYSQTCPTVNKNPWEWPSHSNWFIGNGLKGKFSGGSLTISTIPNITSYEGITAASDDWGNLLFLANGRLLWDANGNLKYSGLLEGNENGSTTTNGSAAQGIITIRHPLDTTNYYIFTTDDALTGTANGLNYFVFDKNGNLKSGPARLGAYRTTEGIAATKHANGVDIWVTVWGANTNDFYTYLITCTGVISTPVISSVAPNTLGDMNKERGGLAFSWDSKHFAQVHGDYSPNAAQDVSVYLFDNKTGIISDPHDIADPVTYTDITSPYDVLFSPDNSKLYVSTSQGKLCYYDISSWNTLTMVASFKSIAGVSTGSHSAIEIGGDGNLYMATLSSGLGKLTGNLNAGTLTYSNIAGATTNRGLPTMYLPPYEEPDIQEAGTFCLTDPSMDLSTTWICSGLNAEDTVANPNAYSGPGITNAGTGIFDPAIAGVGSHQIIFKRCSVDDTIYITVNSCGPTVTTTNKSVCSGSCNNITATGANGTPPYTYSWSPGAGTGSNVSVCPASTTTYTVVITDGAGQTASGTAVVTVNASPTINITGTTSICAGSGTTLTASGGSVYSWSTGATTTAITITPSGTSSYSVINTSNGCTGSAAVVVTVNPKPVPTIGGTTVICAGSSTTLTATGGGSYVWSTGDLTASVTITPVAGTSTYTVTVTTGGCNGTATIQVTAANNIIPVITGTPVICNGMSTTLTTSGGGTYLWSDGTTNSVITVSPLINTTYSVTVTNGSCSGTAQQLVTVISNPGPVITGNTTICSGQTTTLTANAGGSYSWNSGASTSSITVSPTITTSYTVIVTTNGCTGSATAQVTVNPIPNPIISGSTTICTGQSTTLTSSTAGPYSWNTGATNNAITVSPTITTSYSVSVTVNGCTGTAAQTVTVIPPVKASITGNDICAGQTTSLIASGGTNYLWSTSETTNPIIISPSSTSTYTVVVSTGSCADTAIYIVTVNPLPTASASGDTSITYGNTVQLHSSGGGTYNWIPSTGLSCTDCPNPVATPTAATQYCVIVKNSAGCTDSACITVRINLECGDNGDLYVPNGFSPNGDGQNDVLYVRGGGVTSIYWAIYDRWGEKVFETTNSKQGWDGTYKGKELNPAVFVYYLKVNCFSGIEIIKKGNVAIIK